MKRARRLLVAALASAAAGALLRPAPGRADYPIFYQRYTADPSGLEAGGRLYLYASHDLDGQTSYVMNDITCISTADLKNWTDHGECFRVPGGSSWATFAWAPAVVQRDGRFYMYYGNGGGSIGVAVADSPAGPFRDPRSKALVDGGTPGVNPPAGMWIFDPGVLVDDDGKAWLYFGGNGPSNIRVIQLGADMTSTVGSAVALTAPHFFEDSWIHKRDGKYYYSYSTNWDAGAPTIDYMMSSSPTSGFQHAGTVLPQPPQNGNNNHHSIFQFRGSWYIAYHNRTLAAEDGVEPVYHRNLGIDRLTYAADGRMNLAAFTADGVPQLGHLDPYTRVEGETMHREHGVETEECSAGGRDVSSIESGDWIEVAGVDFGAGATRFDARVASGTTGGRIELRLDALSGTRVGTCTVQGTGGWQVWTTVSCDVAGATGVHDLYLAFTGGSGSLFNLDWWRFDRAAVDPTPVPSGDTSSGGTSSGGTSSGGTSSGGTSSGGTGSGGTSSGGTGSGGTSSGGTGSGGTSSGGGTTGGSAGAPGFGCASAPAGGGWSLALAVAAIALRRRAATAPGRRGPGALGPGPDGR